MYLELQYSSTALQMNTAVRIVMPDTGELSKVKTVYLLHGLCDNCAGWSRYTSCERYARERGIAVIMPEVQRSFYMDGIYGLKYFTYVSEELPRAMQRLFGLSADRAQNYVMGFSMGGYGALKCVLTHPERYAGAAGFSSVCDVQRFLEDPSMPDLSREKPALLGPAGTVPPESDLRVLLQKAENLPPLYLSCGEQDALYPMNQDFVRALEEKQAVFRFDHRCGSHSWEFWDQSLRDAFAHFFD